MKDTHLIPTCMKYHGSLIHVNKHYLDKKTSNFIEGKYTKLTCYLHTSKQLQYIPKLMSTVSNTHWVYVIIHISTCSCNAKL